MVAYHFDGGQKVAVFVYVHNYKVLYPKCMQIYICRVIYSNALFLYYGDLTVGGPWSM